MLCDLTLLNPPFGLRLTFPDMARLQLKTVPPSALSTPHNDHLHHAHHEHYCDHRGLFVILIGEVSLKTRGQGDLY